MNKPNIQNNIIGSIPSFQNGLNKLFTSIGFYFKSKVIEGSLKGKNVFLILGTFFKMYIFQVVIFIIA